MPENLLHPAGYVAELDKEGLSIEGKGLAENGKNRDFVGGQIMRKPLSRPKAVKAHCLECSGGTYRAAVLCSIFDCPLWPYRMGISLTSKQYQDSVRRFFSQGGNDIEELLRDGIDMAFFLPGVHK